MQNNTKTIRIQTAEFTFFSETRRQHTETKTRRAQKGKKAMDVTTASADAQIRDTMSLLSLIQKKNTGIRKINAREILYETW